MAEKIKDGCLCWELWSMLMQSKMVFAEQGVKLDASRGGRLSRKQSGGLWLDEAKAEIQDAHHEA